MASLLAGIMVIYSFLITKHALSSKSTPRQLILISLDGFRWDYLNMVPLESVPNFERMISRGVYSRKGLKNVFLTKTQPNHYSIATGLHAESHGIVANKFFDRILNANFSGFNAGAKEDTEFFDDGSEPIWITNQLQNPDHRSGLMMWPGADAKIKGITPYKHCTSKNSSYTDKVRIDQLLQWFTNEKLPINFGLLHIDEPDESGHAFGPNSEQVKEVIQKLDKDVVGYLLDKMTELKLLDTMDIIITADHGMSAIINDSEHRIDLNKYIDITKYTAYETRPVCTLYPEEGYFEEIYKNLSGAHPHLHVYKREDIPEEFHYTHNADRIAPIVAIPDEHYWCVYNEDPGNKGEHGWNNSLSSMHPLFVAMGPSFKRGVSVEQFNSIDLYPMMCYILGLKPVPNNGSLDNVIGLLNTSGDLVCPHPGTNICTQESKQYSFSIYYVVLSLMIGLAAGFLLTLLTFWFRSGCKREHKAQSVYRPVKCKAKGEKGLLNDSSDDELGLV